MSRFQQQDNATFEQKVMLRQTALRRVRGRPIILETYGGRGDLWAAVYSHVEDGIVFEKDPLKSSALAAQRPTWAVYEADCVQALQAGAGSHLCANLLDCDPHGDPWPAITAFFQSERPRAGRIAVVVNDGLGKKVQIGTGWQCKTLEDAVAQFGNDLWRNYLDVCAWMMERAVRPAGYELQFFDGYHCGNDGNLTHYLAVLRQ